jgi:hypothetical protein
MLIPEIAYTDVCSSLRNNSFSADTFPSTMLGTGLSTVTSNTAFTLAYFPRLTNQNDSTATQARQ